MTHNERSAPNPETPNHGYMREDSFIYEASRGNYLSLPDLTKIKVRIERVMLSNCTGSKSGIWALQTNSCAYSFLKMHWCCEPDFKIVAGINVEVIILEENEEKLASGPRFAKDGKHLFLSSAVEAEEKLNMRDEVLGALDWIKTF